MAKINLLPWREKEREKRNREFIVQLIVVGLLSLLGAFLVWTYFNTQLESQEEANNVVQQANTALDRDLEEIKELEQTKEDIVSRMKVIQDLQGTRPIPVHIFDNLVRVMPANLFINRITLKGDVLTLEGRADNPNTVSDLLRNIDLTKWLGNSAVKKIANNYTPPPTTQRKEDGTVIVAKAPAPEVEYIQFVMTTIVRREALKEEVKTEESDVNKTEQVEENSVIMKEETPEVTTEQPAANNTIVNTNEQPDKMATNEQQPNDAVVDDSSKLKNNVEKPAINQTENNVVEEPDKASPEPSASNEEVKNNQEEAA